MIFAELEYQPTYSSFHPELRDFLSAHFSQVESGLQGDSWIWILDDGERVEIDTFSSMKHQIKSAKPGQHVQRVIDTLKQNYKVNVYQEPQMEAHEDR